MNNLNPTWNQIHISMQRLCNGDPHRPLKLDVFDCKKNPRPFPLLPTCCCVFHSLCHSGFIQMITMGLTTSLAFSRPPSTTSIPS